MPCVTGSWWNVPLPQADFEQLHQNGGYFHFRENSPAQAAVRSHIADLAVTHGWPLHGMFISGSGETPHFALHISEFPTQIGGQREEKLQNAIDAMFAATYEDVDLGRDEPGTLFRAKCHVWRYDNQNDYAPRVNGIGDFALSPLYTNPRIEAPANWWQGL